MGHIRRLTGKTLIGISNHIYKSSRALCSCLLRPDDLIALTQQCYSLPGYLSLCSQPDYLKQGLTPTEKYFVDTYVPLQARVLVVGCGGGRECIGLAQRGLRVTGVDFVEDCVRIARDNTRRVGCHADYICQQATNLRFPQDMAFEAVVLSGLMYSLIPSRARRLAVLTALKNHLTPDAVIFLNFFSTVGPARLTALKKFIAAITFNTSFEDGDYVENDGEFHHYFHPDAITTELLMTDYRIRNINTTDPSDSYVILDQNPRH